MNFIGVDLHKKSITVCVMDQNRKVLARKTINCKETNEIIEFFRKETNEIIEFFRKFQPFKATTRFKAKH